MEHKKKLYLSFDVETDGNTPVLNNMLSIGIYGIDKDLNEVFTFDANIFPLPNRHQESTCMETFWLKDENKLAWDHLKINQRHYVDVFVELSEKLLELNETYQLVFVAFPASFDFAFLKAYYEMTRLVHNKPMYNIGFSCKCGSTLWNIYKEKNNLSNKNADELKKILGGFNSKNEHFALEDARFQGTVYVKVLLLLTSV